MVVIIGNLTGASVAAGCGSRPVNATALLVSGLAWARGGFRRRLFVGRRRCTRRVATCANFDVGALVVDFVRAVPRIPSPAKEAVVAREPFRKTHVHGAGCTIGTEEHPLAGGVGRGEQRVCEEALFHLEVILFSWLIVRVDEPSIELIVWTHPHRVPTAVSCLPLEANGDDLPFGVCCLDVTVGSTGTLAWTVVVDTVTHVPATWSVAGPHARGRVVQAWGACGTARVLRKIVADANVVGRVVGSTSGDGAGKPGVGSDGADERKERGSGGFHR
jgi:hypothetical protein